VVSKTELFAVNLANASQSIQSSYRYDIYIRIYYSIIAFTHSI
jgi:hypothetical protein